jgi:hypothetical protein
VAFASKVRLVACLRSCGILGASQAVGKQPLLPLPVLDIRLEDDEYFFLRLYVRMTKAKTVRHCLGEINHVVQQKLVEPTEDVR